MKELFNGDLAIVYGQFYIDIAATDHDEPEDDYLEPDSAFTGQSNGICGAAQEGKLFFVTGIKDGAIDISCEYHESAPVVDNSYDEIVEASLEVGDVRLSLCEWGHENTHDLDLPKGQYRVRYLARGMDEDYDDDSDDEEYWEKPLPGQHHLVQIWPAELEKDSVLKVTSDNAKYWHREWGNMIAA